MQTLATCPTVGGPLTGGTYGWTWCDTRGSGDETRLTLAGMGHVSDAGDELRVLLAAVAVLVRARRSFKPSPTEVRRVQVRATELRDALAPELRLDPVGLANIRDALKHEPATWHCNVWQPPDNDDWVVTLSPSLRGFRGLFGSSRAPARRRRSRRRLCTSNLKRLRASHEGSRRAQYAFEL
jgi:hypothetical protein